MSERNEATTPRRLQGRDRRELHASVDPALSSDRWRRAFGRACGFASVLRQLRARRVKPRKPAQVVASNDSSSPRQDPLAESWLRYNFDVEGIPCPLGASVALLQSRDIEIHAGEIIDHDVGGWAALKRGKSFDVTETALARVDRGIRAAFLRHERDQLFMIRRATIRASQTLSLPTPTAKPAAQVPSALDPSNFDKDRPGAP